MAKKLSVSRRSFLSGVFGSVAASQVARASVELSNIPTLAPREPFILTTWDFGTKANEAGFRILETGGSAIDAIEASINYAELLPDEYTVGFGGMPNEVGETTLDAMMLWAPTHDVGAVGCLKRVKRAISVARKVMEETQHSLIVGDDATRFAVRMGFEETSLTNLTSQTKWEDWVAQGIRTDAFDPEPFQQDSLKGHDTVGSIAVDARGDLCVGCSTNGRELKIPGRVGDSPIAGAGAYADQDVGAAVATGNGDVMMRFLPTYHTVELMRTGMSPEEAAAASIKRITDKGYKFGGGIVAARIDGLHGGAKAGWEDVPFSYSVQTQSSQQRYPV
ncbi:N(4)-(beta-N-acetylglucosaminyl)-L-asparaginase [Parahalioglobus pacificus]|uniref:Asparaginase n=1 Tax=Parahalioglobus pacificus TaxID=930806 RepID=A0A918XFE4_9GAMM|nr:N(4)-(beta-N-acetylglucosaminyl)-L-asparaginase [Halioglobus pacificus]GHD28201.1 asparaginase [Halioglobus pacificus]